MNVREQFFGESANYRNLEERQKIADYIRINWKQELEQVIRIADDACENQFLFDLPWDMERTWEPVLFGEKINWEYMPEDDPEFVFQLNRHRFFICMGQAYWITQDEKYAKHFVRLMEDWMKDNPLNAHTENTTWRTIEAGIRGEYWTKAITYFSASPYITEDFISKFIDSLRVHADYLVNSRRGMQISSNWGVLENHGLYMIGASLGEEGKKYCEIAKERLEEEARVQVFQDGVHWEQSAMYHNEVMHCFLEVMQTARKTGDCLPEKIISIVENMALADLKMIKPDHHQLMSGDSDDTDVRDLLTNTSYILYKYGKRETASYIKYAAYSILDFESIWDFGIEAAEEYKDYEAKIMQRKDFYLEESGNYVMRSGWKETDSYLHFKNGCLGNGHGHSDKLHFDWCVRGEDVLMDSGRYSYVYSQQGRIGLKSALAHNCFLVDRQDYMKYPDAWGVRGSFKPVKYPAIEREGIIVVGGGHTGYLQNGSGAYVERKMIKLEDDLFILLDVATAPEEHVYSQLFHFNNRGRIEVENHKITYVGDNAEAQIHLLGKNLQVKSSVQKISRHYNMWEDHVVIEAEKKGSGVCSFIAVLCGGEKDNLILQTSLLPVENPVTGRILPDDMAQGVQISTAEHIYTVILRHSDLMIPADLLKVNSCMGMGTILVSKDKKKPVVFA